MSGAVQERSLPTGAVDVSATVHWEDHQELTAHLPLEWREYIAAPPVAVKAGVIMAQLVPGNPYPSPGGDRLHEATALATLPRDDRAEAHREALLSGGIEHAIVVSGQGAQVAALVNHHLGHQVIRAANDWLVETYLSSPDNGLSGLGVIPNALPEAAVDEARRIGAHPRIAGIAMGANGAGKPYGHPVYHPLYAALIDLDLPLVLTPGADESHDTITQPTAGGLPLTHGEMRALRASATMTQLVSMVGQGVFEKFPGLRVLVQGVGALWLPSLYWRFDIEWKGLRREAPWVKRLPSEYLREHVRVSLDPVPRRADADRVRRSLEAYDDMSELLCYGSGYPAADTSRAPLAQSVIPQEWDEAVFRDNARTVFRS